MRALPRRRRIGRARLAAVSLAAAGALALLLPAVASASTGHGGGAGSALLVLPIGSIFSDVLGSVAGFGKDIVKTIFSSILTLFFGGSWKVLLQPYEIVEWLIGLPGTGNTTAFVPFAASTAGGAFGALVKDTQSIGLGLLPLALVNNTVHLVSGGVFTRPRDHAHDFGKVFMAACAILAWPWLFGQAIDIANIVTLALLHAANANDNLWKTLGAYFATAWAGGFLDLLTTGFLIATALLLVGLIVMKIVLMVVLAFLLVIGPIAIAFYPFEFLSRVLMLFGSVFLAVAMVPLGWAVLFALFTAFGASVVGFGNFVHAGLIGGAMKDTFNLICSLICFYLAWKWPFLIIGRVSGLVGGGIAEAGQAFSALGHRSQGAGAGAGTSGRSGAAAGVGGSADAGGLSGKLQGLGSFAQGLGGGGGVLAGLGSSGATYAGYGLGVKGFQAASSAVRRYGGGAAATDAATGAVSGGGAATGATADGGDGGQPANPVGAAIANGTNSGFDAVRTGGKDFSTASDIVAAGGGAQSAAPAQTRARHAAAAAAVSQTLARHTAALTGDTGGSSLNPPTPATSTGTPNGAGAAGGASNGTGAADVARAAHAALNGTPPAPNGTVQPASPSPRPGGSATGIDPRQVLHASAPTASTAGPSPASGSRAASDAAPAMPRLAGQSAPTTSNAPAARPTPPTPAPTATRAARATPAPAAAPGKTSAPPSRPAQRNGASAPAPAPAPPATGSGRGDAPAAPPDRPPAPVSPPESGF